MKTDGKATCDTIFNVRFGSRQARGEARRPRVPTAVIGSVIAQKSACSD
jgi:hypothetical protein